MRSFIIAVTIAALSLVLGAVDIAPASINDVTLSHHKIVHSNQADTRDRADKDVNVKPMDAEDRRIDGFEYSNNVAVPLTVLVEINNATYKQKGYDHPFVQLYRELEEQNVRWTVNEVYDTPGVLVGVSLNLGADSDVGKVRNVTNVERVVPALLANHPHGRVSDLKSSGFGDREPEDMTFLIEINNATYKQKGYDHPLVQLYRELEEQDVSWTFNEMHDMPGGLVGVSLDLRELDVEKVRNVTNVERISPVPMPKGPLNGSAKSSELESADLDATYKRATRKLLELCKTVQDMELES